MKKNFFGWLIVFFSLLSLLTYIKFCNPLFVKMMNINSFDKREIEPKVSAIAETLLNKKEEYQTTEKIFSDLKTVTILQKNVGIKSATELIQIKLPSQFLNINFYNKIESRSISIQKNPVLTIEVDSNSYVSFLRYPFKESITSNDVPSIIQNMFPILELNLESLEQIAPDDIKKEELEEIVVRERENEKLSENGKLYREIIYKQKIEGVPLGFYIHKFVISEKELIYSKTLAFKKSLSGQSQSPIIDIFKFLIWFIIGLFSLALLFIKIKRDEIDWSLYVKVMAIASIFSFLLLFKEQPTVFLFFVFLLISFLFGSFFALIVALSESQTREIYPENLHIFDALFQGHLRIKELGEMILLCFIYGNFYFLIQILFLFAPNFNETLKVSILPPNPLEFKSFFPLSLFLGNIIAPATFGLYSLLIFGVVAPLFFQRFNKNWIKLITIFLFSILVSSHLSYTPFYLSFISFLFLSFFILHLWEKYGFLGIFFAIWMPVTLQRGLMLFMAKDVSFAVTGLLILLFLFLMFIFAFYLYYKGKPVSTIKSYEPLYLIKIREKERFSRELEIAKNLQQQILPKKHPKIDKIEFATLCEPALSVGGDYFDFFELGNNKILVFLGDVSGKGIRAAFYMTLAKGLLHGSFNLVKDHKELLKILNQRFGALCEEGVFLTLTILSIDCKTGEIIVTSAGHNPPLLYKNGEVITVPSKGLVVGPMPEEIMLKSLEEYKFKIEKGDVLLLYTDGVTEAMNPYLEEYSLDRLKSVFANCIELSAEEIVSRIRLSIMEFASGSPLSDDLTILVLKGIDERK